MHGGGGFNRFFKTEQELKRTPVCYNCKSLLHLTHLKYIYIYFEKISV